MRQSSNLNSTTFKLRTFPTDSKFDEYFKRLIVECKFVETSTFYDWFHMHIEPNSTDKLVFLNIKFNLSHKQQLLNVQFNVCSVMCYTVHWFYWHDKTNASICIRICQILISRHSHMQILTSFSTSLPWIYQQTSRTNICDWTPASSITC